MTRDSNKNNARRVWAILLMYGAEDITAECIDALLRQDYPLGSLDILVVDNASPNGQGDRIRTRYPQVHHLSAGSNLGYAGGNNLGMRYAIDRGAELLVLLNNDTVPAPSCVSQLVETANHADRVGAVSPKILYYDAPDRIAFAGGDYSVVRAVGTHRHAGRADDPDERPRVDEITFVTGACFLVPADVAGVLGGFREDFFMYCEDVELSFRMRRAGYRLYYQPAARVLHREPLNRTLSPAFGTFYRDRNRRRLVRAHYGPLQRVVFALWFYPTRIVRLSQYLFRGDWSGAKAIVSGAVRR